ncbi:MAG: hypothetical protein ACLRYM_14860 [Thomasclavelia ramosa]
MKTKIYFKFFIIILFAIFVSGCDRDIFKDPTYSDKIEFEDDIVINLSKNYADTTKYVKSVDGHVLQNSNRDFENHEIRIDNYIISCPKFKPEKEGKYNLVYKLGEYEYSTTVEVRDIEGPRINLKTENYDITIGDKFNIKNIDFDVEDNLSKNKNIKRKLKGKFDVNKVGKYSLKLVCTDEKENTSTKDIKLTVYEKPQLTVSKEELQMYISDTVEIQVVAKGKNKDELTWSSSNNSIVSVANNIVHANGIGETTITVSCGNGLSKNINVKVISKENINSSSNKGANSNNSNSSNSNANNNSNNVNSNSSSKPNPKTYDKFFSGNSIDTYNKAYSYAADIFSSGKVNGFSVNPTGTGFWVTFN